MLGHLKAPYEEKEYNEGEEALHVLAHHHKGVTVIVCRLDVQEERFQESQNAVKDYYQCEDSLHSDCVLYKLNVVFIE
jgi:hypothetical protein